MAQVRRELGATRARAAMSRLAMMQRWTAMAVALSIASAIAPLAQARSLTHPTAGDRVEPPPVARPREPPRAFAALFVERPDDPHVRITQSTLDVRDAGDASIVALVMTVTGGTDTWQIAELTLNVPADARVVGMSFRTRDEMLVARPLPVIEARRQFDDATGVIRDPALLEALRPSRERAGFRLSLYPVSPDDQAMVTLAIALPRVQRVLVDVAGDRLDARPAPGAAPSPDDLAAVAAPAADARLSLYAGPTGGDDQPRSAADIRDHVRVSRNELRSCHALPGAAGDAITLHFTVTAEGEVTDAAVSGDADPDVGDCLSRVMASWHFQPAAAAVQVNYPLRFVRTARPAPPAPRAPMTGKQTAKDLAKLLE
jgi:hypothetical protein